ncbi:unnamed protein product [Acanthoscelides obtectus]|uniref:Mif2/CENP-C cupin domain-containing protein n=1 Tax=Acanthoscelides obtectus TaxID=200917 RepID=A0A9P0PHT5_ACAOB|nr:unnamed protein product [Acanthoscelides obtectus]CAK1681571.1 hypothetical protein AOBTE_LOCUS33166 [Acanthoscelides obtectus]
MEYKEHPNNAMLMWGYSPVMDRVFLSLKPGGEKSLAKNNISEMGYLVLSGRAVVRVGDQIRLLVPENQFVVPQGLPYSITNSSAENFKLLRCIPRGRDI